MTATPRSTFNANSTKNASSQTRSHSKNSNIASTGSNISSEASSASTESSMSLQDHSYPAPSDATSGGAGGTKCVTYTV
jgi:hypothetical protein